MTDRYAGYVVTLERDVREDNAQSTIAAIRQIKGVLNVTPVAANMDVALATERAGAVWKRALLDLVRDGRAQIRWPE